MSQPTPVTLADLARHLGMSKSTVQRALVNAPRCSPETAKRVREAAKIMGYRPDPVFAAMGSRRARKSVDGMPLAYIVCQSDGMSGSKHYLGFLRERAQELGYRIEVINLLEWPSPRRFWKILYARGIVGVLIGAVRAEDVEMLSDNDIFPAVTVGRTQVLPYHSVRPAILGTMHDTWRQLLSLGYKRIGAAIMHHNPVIEDDFSRLAGVLACQHQEQPDQSTHVPPLFEPLSQTEKIVPWYKKHKPDVVLGFHIGHYYALKEANVNIPKDVGFTCLHLHNSSPEFASGDVAGISQNFRQISITALNLIDQMIRHGERGRPELANNILVQSLWHHGKSVRGRAATTKPVPVPISIDED